jgi:hypothetical protein
VNRYIFGIKKFIEFINEADPESALQKIKEGTIDPIQEINRENDGFIDTMLEKYASKTVTSTIYGVKKWLEVNQINLNWTKVDMPTTTTRERDRAPTQDEIMKLLNHAPQLKDRVVIQPGYELKHY